MSTINDIEFIIICGGLGTRNYPHSKSGPKALLPLGSYRIIDHMLKDIFRIGGKNITIVCSDDEASNAFKKAFADDTPVQEKLIARGKQESAELLKSIAIPQDVKIKYAIQEKPLGTAHALLVGHEVSKDKHAVMMFADEVYFSADESNPHIGKLVNEFLNNEKQILITGIEKEDVSSYGIIQNGRLVEKPTNAETKIAAFSPIIFPKAVLDHMHGIMSACVVDGGEWFYTDAVNDFLDNNECASEYELKIPIKDDEDIHMDVGSLDLYEKALLYSLLTLSKDKDEHLKDVKDYISAIK